MNRETEKLYSAEEAEKLCAEENEKNIMSNGETFVFDVCILYCLLCACEWWSVSVRDKNRPWSTSLWTNKYDTFRLTYTPVNGQTNCDWWFSFVIFPCALAPACQIISYARLFFTASRAYTHTLYTNPFPSTLQSALRAKKWATARQLLATVVNEKRMKKKKRKTQPRRRRRWRREDTFMNLVCAIMT